MVADHRRESDIHPPAVMLPCKRDRCLVQADLGNVALDVIDKRSLHALAAVLDEVFHRIGERRSDLHT